VIQLRNVNQQNALLTVMF